MDSDQNHEMPDGKMPFPVRSNEPPFSSLERYIEIDRLSIWGEAKREIKTQAKKQLELLDQIHKELIEKAHAILDKAKLDIELHEIPMFSSKIRGRTYYLYESGQDIQNSLFFSILDPSEYQLADATAVFRGSYRLNEDSSWTYLASTNPDQ